MDAYLRYIEVWKRSRMLIEEHGLTFLATYIPIIALLGFGVLLFLGIRGVVWQSTWVMIGPNSVIGRIYYFVEGGEAIFWGALYLLIACMIAAVELVPFIVTKLGHV